MLFEQKTDDLMLSLTWNEANWVQHAHFIQKDEILESINRMDFKGKAKKLFRVKNILRIDYSFKKQEELYIFPDDKDRFASDLMDLSMGYAILKIGTDIIDFNEMVVAETAHNTTNIDADVIGAFIKKIDGIDGKD